MSCYEIDALVRTLTESQSAVIERHDQDLSCTVFDHKDDDHNHEARETVPIQHAMTSTVILSRYRYVDALLARVVRSCSRA